MKAKTSTTPWDFLDRYRGAAFDGEWPSLPDVLRITASQYPDRPCFTVFSPNRVSLDYTQAVARVERLGSFLLSAGVKPGETLAVTGKNSPEWAVAYLAIQAAGAVVVPIDYQLHESEMGNILRASGAVGLFIDEEKYDQFDPATYGLRARWSLSPAKPGYAYDLEPAPNAPRLPRIPASDLAAILYTSGTTGTPKGVMLTHGNLVSDCYLAQANLTVLPTDTFYALLPIHHSYTMLAVFIEAISTGAELVFGQRMVTKAILSDLKEARVTMFLGVPLLFNKVLAGIMKGIHEKGPLVEGVLKLLMVVSGMVKKLTGRNPGKKLFRAVLEKASLDSIRICISGGGPLAPSVFRKYNQLGIDFVQGYGLTETSPILTLNPVDDYVETSVGKLIPRVEMRILDPDADGRGEIAVKGPMVMKGYYRNEEATREVFTEDGWFRTGDIGWLDSRNYLYLTGRAKNLIVTEGGKNVYPEEIENRFQLHGEVEQVLIRGYEMDRKRKIEGIEALVYPNKEWFEQRKGADTVDEGEVEDRIKTVVDEVNASMLPYQRISRVTVLDEPLEMTTTKKVKRFVVK